MKSNFQIIIGLGLIGITVYDIVVAGFHYKHAIFIGIAAIAIVSALGKK
jgi:hypothetical protein